MESQTKPKYSVYRDRKLASVSREISDAWRQENAKIVQEAFAPLIEMNKQIHKSFSQSIFLNIPPLLPQALQQKTSPTTVLPASLFEVLPSIRVLSETFRSVEQSFDPIRKQLAGVIESSELLRKVVAEQAARDAIVLDDSGFFFRQYLAKDDLFKLFGIERVDCRVRDAVLTNKLLDITRKEDFARDLETYFKESPILRRRWPIMEQTLETHMNRNYLLSIPLLLAQCEGVFVDALVMKEIVYVENYEVYRRNMDPQNPKGKKLISMKKVAEEVKKSELQEDENYMLFTNYIISTLAPERNHIMHGRKHDYNKAKLSVKLLLNTWCLANEISSHTDSQTP